MGEPMLPPRRLFHSRWTALFWAAGVLWFAYDVAASAPRPADRPAPATDASGDTPDAADIAAIVNAVGG